MTGLAIEALVALIVALIWSLGQVQKILSPVLWPLAVAGVLAYLLDPVVHKLERRGLSRQRAIIAVFALALLLIVGLFGSVVPQVVIETRRLARQLPAHLERAEVKFESVLTNPPPLVRKLFWKDESTAAPGTSVLVTNEAGEVVANVVASPPCRNEPGDRATGD